MGPIPLVNDSVQHFDLGQRKNDLFCVEAGLQCTEVITHLASFTQELLTG